MDFVDEVKALAKRAQTILDNLATEEATKNALVLPFLQTLGYPVFDPRVVVPEFTADVGAKKGEKVDYAIIVDGKPAILIEAKIYGDDLTTHNTQLFRYFTATEAKFAILTNGIVFRFFSDLHEPNRMDNQPFFEFNLLEAEDAQINELKRFHRENFDLEDLTSAAAELKYTRGIKQMLEAELRDPSDDFVRFWLKDVHGGRLTRNIVDQFRPTVKRAFAQYINDLINNRLKSAMAASAEAEGAPSPGATEEAAATVDESGTDDIVTTLEELEAVYVIKAILRREIDPGRIGYIDRKHWCNVVIDGSKFRWLCRLMLDGPTKRVELNDVPPRRVTIERIDDLYSMEDDLIRIARRIDAGDSSREAPDSDE